MWRKENRMKRIGIPRGMLYYENYPFWKDYFEEIGCEVVLSNETNKDIMDDGILNSVDEACLPVKIFHGHVSYLKDKVDYIFIPKIISLQKREYCCPKILGLSAMIKNSVDNLPEILDMVFDINKINGLKKGYLDIGRHLDILDGINIKAYRKAYHGIDKYSKWIESEILPKNRISNPDNRNLLVLGHSYNVFDEFINMNILNKLVERHINLYIAEDVDNDEIQKLSKFTNKRIFWTHGRRIIGAANYYIMNKKTDGIIYLSSFGCGLDSVLIYIVNKLAYQGKIPFMNLILDEQTGEAGMNTRLEAFLDMMSWRDKNKNYISTFR